MVTWAFWRLRSPTAWLFVQHHVGVTTKSHTKLRITVPLYWESTGYRWIPIRRRQWCRKRAHIMMSQSNVAFWIIFPIRWQYLSVVWVGGPRVVMLLPLLSSPVCRMGKNGSEACQPSTRLISFTESTPFLCPPDTRHVSFIILRAHRVWRIKYPHDLLRFSCFVGYTIIAVLFVPRLRLSWDIVFRPFSDVFLFQLGLEKWRLSLSTLLIQFVHNIGHYVVIISLCQRTRQ